MLSHSPNNCKLAKLNTLYKKDSKIDPKNLWPMCHLFIISKITDKIIYNQTMEYPADNKVLYRYQSVFRENHSTDTCLLYLTDKTLTGFYSDILTGMILMNLQKAFDTINHNNLLKNISYWILSSISFMV